jgi:hypothetical protein
MISSATQRAPDGIAPTVPTHQLVSSPFCRDTGVRLETVAEHRLA